MKNKIMSITLIFVILLSTFVTPSFASDAVGISDVKISVDSKDVVSIKGTTSGDADGMSILIRVMNHNETIEYFDQIIIEKGGFNVSFTPSKAKIDDKLILKISGDLNYTKEFTYSRNQDDDDSTSGNSNYLKAINILKSKYKEYTDYNGNLSFDFDISEIDDVYIIKLKGNNFSKSSNLWLYKDSERFEAFLRQLTNEMYDSLSKEIKTYVYDTTPTKVDEYLMSSSDGNSIKDINTIIKEINDEFPTFKNAGHSFKFAYSNDDSSTSKLMKVNIKGLNFLKDDNKWDDVYQTDVTKFLDKVAEKIMKSYKGDVAFYLRDSKSVFINSYDYFNDFSFDTSTGDYVYEPIDEDEFKDMTKLLEYKDYGDSYKKINLGKLNKIVNGDSLSLELIDTKLIIDELNAPEKNLVFEFDVDLKNSKLIIGKGAFQALEKRNKVFTVSANDFQFTINPADLDVSNFEDYKIEIDIIEKSREDLFVTMENHKNLSDVYNISIKLLSNDSYYDLSFLSDKDLQVIIRYDSEALSSVNDLRTVSVFSKFEFTDYEMNNTAFVQNEQGFVFKYNGQQDYLLVNNEKNFDDVNEHWSKDSVNLVASKDLISGKGDNQFDPEANITRAEFITIVTRKLGIDGSGDNHFSDIEASDWFYSFVNAGYEANILPPTFEGSISPNKAITREEMTYILVEAYHKNESNKQVFPSALFYFDSNDVSPWATASVSMAGELGLARGWNNSFNPKNNATRAEAAQMIFNLLRVEKIF